MAWGPRMTESTDNPHNGKKLRKPNTNDQKFIYTKYSYGLYLQFGQHDLIKLQLQSIYNNQNYNDR